MGRKTEESDERCRDTEPRRSGRARGEEAFVGQYAPRPRGAHRQDAAAECDHLGGSAGTVQRRDGSFVHDLQRECGGDEPADRKSTRLKSCHANISYAVFCLKTKTRGASLTSTRLCLSH